MQYARMRFSAYVFALPLLLCACSDVYTGQYEAQTRRLDEGGYEIVLTGKPGISLGRLNEAASLRGKKLCGGEFLPRGSRVDSYYIHPTGGLTRYPTADAHTLTIELECLAQDASL